MARSYTLDTTRSLDYEIKAPEKQPVSFRQVRNINIDTGEELTGMVQGIRASDIEERFARALYKLDLRFDFRKVFVAGRSLPGSVEVDFLVFYGFTQPIQIDGVFTHKSPGQRARDRQNDAILNLVLSGTGALPVVRLPGYKLQTQEAADQEARKIFA